SEVHLSGAPLVLFTAHEHDALTKLSTALQPYAHDRPSSRTTRRPDLLDALLELIEALKSMTARRVIPDDLLVMSVSTTFLGNAFKGLCDSGKVLRLTTKSPPPLGHRVLVISTADCDYAR